MSCKCLRFHLSDVNKTYRDSYQSSTIYNWVVKNKIIFNIRRLQAPIHSVRVPAHSIKFTLEYLSPTPKHGVACITIYAVMLRFALLSPCSIQNEGEFRLDIKGIENNEPDKSAVAMEGIYS